MSFFLLYLVQSQNVHVSLSATDQRFMKFYYLWGLLNMLIGGITGGAISGIMQQALEKRHHGEQFAATIRHRLAVVLEFLPLLRFLPSGVYSHVQVDISTPWGDLLHRQYLFTVLLQVHANEKR